MAADPTLARNLNFSTDYPVDKVIYQVPYHASIGVHPTHADAVTFTIPHNLGFRPLADGIWTTDGWNSSWDFGINVTGPALGNSDVGAGTSVTVYSDATNIYIYVFNYSLVTYTMDFIVFGYLADDDTTEHAFTNYTRDNFLLNTDYNYAKLYDQNQFTLLLPSDGSDATKTIPHGLGYVPNANIWTVEPVIGWTGLLGTESFVGTTGIESHATFDNDNMYITASEFGGGSLIVNYRIYLDD